MNLLSIISSLVLLAFTHAAHAQLSLDAAKVKCVELGFKSGTEQFGRCVLQLSKVEEVKPAPQQVQPPVQAYTPPVQTYTPPAVGATSRASKDCPDCPEMVVIPAGSFDMGGTNANERPVHRVTVSSFSMGKTEVTQGQWRAIMGSNQSYFNNCGDNCPVETVTWEDAKQFISRLNAKTGRAYRLPSEAEWEYACRAGGSEEYCGSDSADDMGWHYGNSGRATHPVAGKQANAWGLHDMSGNVWEWTEYCWNGNYSSAPTDGSAWTAGDCSLRVVRGGSWDLIPQFLRSAYRFRNTTAYRIDSDGLRVARTD